MMNQTQSERIIMFFDMNGDKVEKPPEGNYIMVEANKIWLSYEINIYLMPERKRLYVTYGFLGDAELWGMAFALRMNPPPWAEKEALSYNGKTVYKEYERDQILRTMMIANYACVEVGGSSPDFVDSVSITYNEGLSFCYVRYRGPEHSVYNYVCLKPGQKAVVHRKGYEIRGDDLGCHDEWDETIEYKNVNGEIISVVIDGGHHVECPGAKHRLEHRPPPYFPRW